MLFDGRHPGCEIGRVAGQNLVGAHDAVFNLVNPHQPTKLVGLVRFPFANHFGVRFEQTQHFTFHVTVSTPHSFLGCVITFSTKGRKCRSWSICASTRRNLPTTLSCPFLHRSITSLACCTTLRVSPTNFL